MSRVIKKPPNLQNVLRRQQFFLLTKNTTSRQVDKIKHRKTVDFMLETVIIYTRVITH